MNEENTNKLLVRKFILYSVVILFLLSLVAIYLSANSDNKEDGVLQLHGWVEGTNVTLGAKANGQLLKVLVEEGDQVEVDQLIFEIDPKQIKAQFNGAKADVDRAIVDLKLAEQKSSALIAESEAAALSVRAELVESQALLSRASKDYHRSLPLLEDNTISQSDFDNVEELYFSRKAKVDRISREIDLSEARKRLALTTLNEIELKKMELVAKRAKKDEIKKDLKDTTEFSPISGTVIDKVSEAGEYVLKGTPIVVLVDLHNLYIKTYVEQIDVGKIKINDVVEIKVDSFPEHDFSGRVYFIAPEAEFTPRNIQMNEHRSTIVYKVKIRINNPDGLIKLGLPADVKFHLSSKDAT
jgi:multidrug resistance efflux pump